LHEFAVVFRPTVTSAGLEWKQRGEGADWGGLWGGSGAG